ncbi:MAG: hypothetical protein ABI835_20950 [Chloroflexota bacterium]
MPHQVSVEKFSAEIFDLFKETFEKVNGIFLDRGTSLFETLATVSAEEASRPVSATCASLAAQVEHVRFYIDTLEVYMQGGNPGKVDWGEIWRTVHEVTPEAWEASKNRLRASYERVMTLMKGFERWEGESEISGALAILVHTAYHLGEIRQALCSLKQPTE